MADCLRMTLGRIRAYLLTWINARTRHCINNCTWREEGFMPVSTLIRKQYSLANSVFSPLRDWMQKCKLIRQCRQQLDKCDSYEVACMAREVGVSPYDLRRLVKLGSDATKLLLSRMDALHLNGDALARSEPDVMRDLQRLCSTCANK